MLYLRNNGPLAFLSKYFAVRIYLSHPFTTPKTTAFHIFFYFLFSFFFFTLVVRCISNIFSLWSSDVYLIFFSTLVVRYISNIFSTLIVRCISNIFSTLVVRCISNIFATEVVYLIFKTALWIKTIQRQMCFSIFGNNTAKRTLVAGQRLRCYSRSCLLCLYCWTDQDFGCSPSSQSFSILSNFWNHC